MISGPPNYLCPQCRQPALIVIGETQALCGNEESCTVVMFNPALPDGGLSDPQIIDTEGFS